MSVEYLPSPSLSTYSEIASAAVLTAHAQLIAPIASTGVIISAACAPSSPVPAAPCSWEKSESMHLSYQA